MKDWRLIAKGVDFNRIAEKHDISPILARLLVNRGIVEDKDIDFFLNSTLDDLYDPFLMMDMERACDIIIDAIRNGKSIRVVGDYDADGVCSSAILVRALRMAGAKVSYRLPHRVIDGYGISLGIIDEAGADGVDLIITCDNGIAAAKEILHAKELGMDIIVTDHHEIPFKEENGIKECILPEADSIVNPHRTGDNYPYKNICGALVAYKLVIALKAKIDSFIEEDKNWEIIAEGNGQIKAINSELIDMLLDFAAFATVTDIMPLLDENRVILKYGLNSIKHTKNIGLSALIDATGVKRESISTYHIGFILGPCVNAVGRLYSADLALDLFLTDDRTEALELSKKLIDANEERKSIEDRKLKEAFDIIENNQEGYDYSKDTIFVVYIPECHESLAGLISSKITNKYYRPSIVFTDAETGLKGSGRSIKEYNLFEGLTGCSELITKFGGHPMACGLSIASDVFDEFRRRINEKSTLTEKDLIEKCLIDIDMPINYVSMELLKELERLAPYGMENRTPLFAQRNLSLISKRKNAKGNLLTLEVLSPPHGERQATTMYATMFCDANEVYEELGNRDKVTLAYVPEYNTYFERLQLKIIDFK